MPNGHGNIMEKMITNIMFKISPYHWWAAPPSTPNMPLDKRVQLEFLVAAFQRRIINKSICQQKHKLYASLSTCEAKKELLLTQDDLKNFSKSIMECIQVKKGNYYPTAPPPEKCNYNTYIIYNQQRQIMKVLRKIARKKMRSKTSPN